MNRPSEQTLASSRSHSKSNRAAWGYRHSETGAFTLFEKLGKALLANKC
jgi:hypothetical protein